MATSFSVHALEITKEILDQRDPFKMPLVQKTTQIRSELERFPVEQFKLVGILEGEGHPRGMLTAPDGKTYFVRENMPIGQKRGIIRKITETAVYVREKVTNVLGEDENSDFTIALPSDEKKEVKTTNTGLGSNTSLGW
jgi:Tfp pilus assembly protein PilP